MKEKRQTGRDVNRYWIYVFAFLAGLGIYSLLEGLTNNPNLSAGVSAALAVLLVDGLRKNLSLRRLMALRTDQTYLAFFSSLIS